MKKDIEKAFISVVIFLVFVLVLTATSAVFLVKGIKYHEFALVMVGGIFFIIGFYATAASIKRTIELKFLIKVSKELESSRSTNISQLAEKFNKSEKAIDNSIMKLIKAEFISGFYYDHYNIEKIEDRNKRLSEKERLINDKAAKEVEAKQKVLQEELFEKEKLRSGRCEYCGANVVFRGKDTVCPYCGNLVVAKLHK